MPKAIRCKRSPVRLSLPGKQTSKVSMVPTFTNRSRSPHICEAFSGKPPITIMMTLRGIISLSVPSGRNFPLQPTISSDHRTHLPTRQRSPVRHLMCWAASSPRNCCTNHNRSIGHRILSIEHSNQQKSKKLPSTSQADGTTADAIDESMALPSLRSRCRGIHSGSHCSIGNHREWKNCGHDQTVTDIGELAIRQNTAEMPWTIARAIVRRVAMKRRLHRSQMPSVLKEQLDQCSTATASA